MYMYMWLHTCIFSCVYIGHICMQVSYIRANTDTQVQTLVYKHSCASLPYIYTRVFTCACTGKCAYMCLRVRAWIWFFPCASTRTGTICVHIITRTCTYAPTSESVLSCAPVKGYEEVGRFDALRTSYFALRYLVMCTVQSPT